MLSTVIIGSDQRLVNYLRQVCAEFSSVWIYKSLPLDTRIHEIASALSHYTPDVVFLVVAESDAGQAGTVLAGVQDLLLPYPNTALLPVVGGSEQLFRIISTGAPQATILAHPFSGEEFERAIFSAMERRKSAARRGRLFTFLPAKPGSGATTIALNLAGAIARNQGKKTLVIEADVRSGPIPFLLNLSPTEFGVGDPTLLTDIGWQQATSQVDGVDILTSSACPEMSHGSQWDYYRLLRFARERYDAVLIDLSDVIDEVAEAVAAETDHLFLVVTPDPPAIGMLGRRMWNFEQSGTRTTHIRVVLNRYGESDPPVAELEHEAGRQFAVVLPEDTKHTKEAMRNHTFVNAKAPLGYRLAALGEVLMGSGDPNEMRSKNPARAGFRKLVNHALGL